MQIPLKIFAETTANNVCTLYVSSST